MNLALLVTINVLLLGILLAASYLSVALPIRLSMIDPLVISVVFLAIYVIDFLIVYDTVASGNPSFLNLVSFHFSPDEMIRSFSVFTVLNASFIFGCFAAAVLPPAPVRQRLPRPLDQEASELVLVTLLAASAASIATVYATQGVTTLLDITMERQIFFRKNLLTYLLLSSIFPAFAIYLGKQTKIRTRDLIYISLIIICAFLTGSRFYLIFLLVIMAVRFRGQLPLRNSLWFIPAVPLLVFGLAMMRYVLREQALFSSFWEFLDHHGGLFSLTFRSAEMALAETFTAVAASVELPDRPWLAGLIGLVLLPLPREIFTFKPFGASAEFTAAITPETWLASRSEIVIGGYANLLWEQGPAVAALTCFLVGTLFVTLVRRCAASRDETRIRVQLPYLLFTMFIFLRSDIYNLGLILWPLGAVVLAQRSARKLLELVLVGRRLRETRHQTPA